MIVNKPEIVVHIDETQYCVQHLTGGQWQTITVCNTLSWAKTIMKRCHKQDGRHYRVKHIIETCCYLRKDIL